MSNSVFYTKGDKDEMVMRLSQVHTITLYCPINDYGVVNLMNSLMVLLPKYQSGEKIWKGVPAIDALNAFLTTKTLCDCSGFDVDSSILSIICASLKMFKKLKKINFEFTDDPEIEDTYQHLIKQQKEGIKKSIYKVDMLELNLSEMFSQRVVDLLNKVFIHSGLLPNSYLERKFTIDFKFDEYTSFIDMFLNNNDDKLNDLDANICDYFRSFPPLIKAQKPQIRLITNYSDDVTNF